MNTLPRHLSRRLLEFCQTISPERPRFIRSKPSEDAQLAHCFDNAAREAARAGGSVAYGWAVWHYPHAYFEAEHHGVWRKQSGELLDVSPQYNNYRKILFLPDPGAIYDPNGFRKNRVAPDGDDPRAIEVVALMRERYDLLDACRTSEGSTLDLQTQTQVDTILQRIDAILLELNQAPRSSN